jgi:hypothetical protein
MTALGAPLRHLALTLVLTIVTLAAAGAAGQSAGYEMLIVAMGWPHVILGFYFLLRKFLRRDPGIRVRFALLSLATLAFWTAHGTFDLTALIFVYFFYHAFRDEVAVYLAQQAGYQKASGPYAVAGILPLAFFLLLVAEPQDFRQDLRRVELSGQEIHADGWTLFPFRPVPDSQRRDFYFYLVSPGSPEEPRFLSEGSAASAEAAIMRVDDRAWHEGVTVTYAPDYDGQEAALPPDRPDSWRVLLTGGQRVGQVFTASQNGLSGIWIRTHRPPAFEGARSFVLHLASPPLLPLEPHWSTLRQVLQGLLLAALLWRVPPGLRASADNRRLWLYVTLLSLTFILTRQGLRLASSAGFPVPMIFQFVVVFHYFRWYVVSFDKLRTLAVDARGFAASVVALNLASLLFVAWFYLESGPPALRYAFDYRWFLYALVFHVTFSFTEGPKIQRRPAARALTPPAPSARCESLPPSISSCETPHRAADARSRNP